MPCKTQHMSQALSCSAGVQSEQSASGLGGTSSFSEPDGFERPGQGPRAASYTSVQSESSSGSDSQPGKQPPVHRSLLDAGATTTTGTTTTGTTTVLRCVLVASCG